MTISDYKSGLGSHSKDTKLNLGNLFSNVAATGMTDIQFYGTALALAYSINDAELTKAVEAEAEGKVEANVIEAAKTAASLMAMNNIYYRFIHLSSDKQFGKMPAGLRMNAMANPGVDKADFELYSLAVSALNGCGMCIDAHVKTLLEHSVSAQAIQSSVKLAAVLNAAKTAAAIS
ncbi:carboxymuconolactone decarboxylase family protein [Aliidiomarina maris]|uniref:Alkyl hydroperoxide reductase AhpD n=1 Tax=Aliidiomarina maris TaxID=531312 RepID=A0A327WN27_9GAMM|nr:carboxymuconolactone decarboxylase family protein [Aliidiomarina maris]MCL5049877.1 carboxymuconolactone decarboxylase family protein [Bacillota bacterium]RAJ93583.1 alkyl hydroperoxide reductase subunit D [Aliidiomarina maris]RUO18785.1 alkyl hydroperoxide reductase [Aliidiomarina maris]